MPRKILSFIRIRMADLLRTYPFKKTLSNSGTDSELRCRNFPDYPTAPHDGIKNYPDTIYFLHSPLIIKE